jgi:VWFA-related protein
MHDIIRVDPMNKPAARSILALAFFVAGLLPAQDIQHERTAINVEIPVRVFKGDTFVDNLTIADFEVYEDGKLQDLEAVYFVKKKVIERHEETTPFSPDTSRHFYLFFEMTEYDPKIREALNYFIDDVLLPGDELIIVTPMKTYRMKSDVLNDKGRDKVFEQILGILRRDILVGSAEYRDILEELQALALTMVGAVGLSSTNSQSPMSGDPFLSAGTIYDINTSVEEQLQMYASCLSRLEKMRQVDQAKISALADHLRGQSGRKEIFLFYQREFIPKLDPMVLTAYQAVFNDRPDIIQSLTGLFEFFKRETNLDIDPIRKAYADSGAAVHFLFLTRPAPKVPGVVMQEQSEDIFAPFREMSRATGGYIASTANIAAAMRSAVSAAENYYLLYYTPKGYVADGRFHALEVRLKSGNYRLSHRLGYIAD